MGVADRDWMRERKTDWGSARSGRRGGGRSVRSWLVLGILIVVGVFLLPYVAIDGHHYRLFFFP